MSECLAAVNNGHFVGGPGYVLVYRRVELRARETAFACVERRVPIFG